MIYILMSLLALNVALANPPDVFPALRKPQSVLKSEGPATLTVMSWNVKKLGRANFNLDHAANLLRQPDMITLQEVNGGGSGLKALQTITAHLEKSLGQKLCMGLSEQPSGSTERYAYIWKNSRVAYVKTDGEVMENCPSTAITIRLGVRNADRIVREPAFGTFYFKPRAKPFVFSSIHLVPSGKKPQLEVPPLFETFKDLNVPVIVAGDYNLDSTHSSFDSAREMKFAAAMRGVKTSLKMKKRELNKPYDNFWYRDVKLVRSHVINIYDAFPTLGPREIYDGLSDHSPVVAEFAFLGEN